MMEKSHSVAFPDIIERGIYLPYCCEKCCIVVDSVASKRASDATARRDFEVSNVLLNDMLRPSRSKTYLNEENMCELFDPKVVSANKVDESFKEITRQANSLLCGSLSLSLAGTNASIVGQHIGEGLEVLMNQISQKHIQLMEHSRKLDNELPYNTWLHQYLEKVLSPYGFIVDTQSKEIKPIAPVCEYSSSHPDLLIFHNDKCIKKVGAVCVKPIYGNVDVLCFSTSQAELEEVTILNLTGELKVDKTGDESENECFYNMFGQGVNLAMLAISNGQLVKIIEVYGIVVAVHQPDKARLLHILLDFEKNKCSFSRVRMCYTFTFLMNLVLNKLLED